MRPFLLCVWLVAVVEAFSSSLVLSRLSSTQLNGYVPDGFTADEWKKLKAKEAKQKATKNLGGLGPKGFKSRSFQSFHEALERGEAEHLLPVLNAKERVQRGELRPEDIPYMQRGGAWDQSDIKGARRVKWLKSDKDYADGGYKKEQSVSIFGYGEGLDWTGTRGRSGPPETISARAPKFSRNYKAPNVKDFKKGDEEMPRKKFFGLF